MKREAKPTKSVPSVGRIRCEEFVGLLTEYWENDEDVELRVEIEAHVETCPACAEILRDYLETVRQFRSAPRVTEPGDVHQRFWRELARELAALKDYLK